MARIPTATRDSVPADQRTMFDDIVKGLGAVPQHGPASVLIHVPQAHHWVFGLNRYLRKESSLPLKVLELAMLVSAREFDCQHIWNSHAPSARKAGVPDALVESLRDDLELPELAADETVVVQFGRELFRNSRVSRGAWQAALELFGRQGVIELAVLFGNYSSIAMLINAFDTDLPPNRTERLLPVDSL